MLEGYGSLCTINGQILKMMSDAESRLLSTTAQWGETRSSGTAKDAIGDNMAAIHSAANRLDDVSTMLGGCLDVLLEAVVRVNDEDALAARILALRYMEPGRQPEFQEIACELGYSYNYVVEKHLRGLDLVSDAVDDVMRDLKLPK